MQLLQAVMVPRARYQHLLGPGLAAQVLCQVCLARQQLLKEGLVIQALRQAAGRCARDERNRRQQKHQQTAPPS